MIVRLADPVPRQREVLRNVAVDGHRDGSENLLPRHFGEDILHNVHETGGEFDQESICRSVHRPEEALVAEPLQDVAADFYLDGAVFSQARAFGGKQGVEIGPRRVPLVGNASRKDLARGHAALDASGDEAVAVRETAMREIGRLFTVERIKRVKRPERVERDTGKTYPLRDRGRILAENGGFRGFDLRAQYDAFVRLSPRS